MTNILSAEQNAQAKRSPANKTHVSYWKKRIFQPVYIRDSQKITSPNFCIEIQHAGERRRWSLGPGTREIAAARARTIYLHLITHGWASTIERFKPQSAPKVDCSLGDFLLQVEKTSDLAPRTRVAYIAALQKIVADISGLASDNAKYAAGSKSRKAWLSKLHAVKLSVLSPQNIQQWKISFLGKAAQDPVSLRSARVSCNSFLRSARSLFSKKILAHLGGLQLPAVLPFANVEFESKVGSKYRSDIDLVALIEAARDELASAAPEVFKCFALALFAGLRRREIDLLPWSGIDFERGVISIAPTQHFSGKSEDSYNDVPLDLEVLALFRQYRETATSEFVIESDEAPRPEVLYNHYRCQEHFTHLINWLRQHGVRGKKPIHILRKEFGSQLCQAHGIYAASRGLRHSSIAISAAFYTDSRARATVGLGHLLETGKVVEFKREVA